MDSRRRSSRASTHRLGHARACARSSRRHGRAIGDRFGDACRTPARCSSTMSAPLAAGPAVGIGPAVARGDQPHLGQPEIEHRARRLADILAELRADQDDDGRAGGRHSSCRDPLGGVASFSTRSGEFLEIARLAEVLVDAGEADVGDRGRAPFSPSITIFADPRRADFALAQRLDLALDAAEPAARSAPARSARLRQAMAIERASLSRSNGSRLPSFLTTVRSRSWTRSKVVKRAPQPSHCRRRRIAAPSSVGRLSFTWLSSWAQNGQRIVSPDRSGSARTASRTRSLTSRLDRAVAVAPFLPGRRARRRPCRRSRGTRPRRSRAWCRRASRRGCRWS